MFNIALGWTFLISAIASPGGKLLSYVFDPEVLRVLPRYQQIIATIGANYWIPALLIYLLLKGLKGESRLRPNRAIHMMFGTANVLMTLYAVLRVFTAMVPGGGATFALASFAVIVAVPSWLSVATASAWLIVRSIRANQTNETVSRAAIPHRFLTPRVMVAILLLVPPNVFFAWVYVTQSATIQSVALKNTEKSARFEELCQSARIDIRRTVSDATSVLFLQRSNLPFVLLEKLDFVEVKREPWLVTKNQEPYQRFLKKAGETAVAGGDGNRISEEASKSMAQYEIERKAVTSAADKKNGFYVEEIDIRDRHNGELLATFSRVEMNNPNSGINARNCPLGSGALDYTQQATSYVLGLMDHSSATRFANHIARFNKQKTDHVIKP